MAGLPLVFNYAAAIFLVLSRFNRRRQYLYLDPVFFFFILVFILI